MITLLKLSSSCDVNLHPPSCPSYPTHPELTFSRSITSCGLLITTNIFYSTNVFYVHWLENILREPSKSKFISSFLSFLLFRISFLFCPSSFSSSCKDRAVCAPSHLATTIGSARKHKFCINFIFCFFAALEVVV